MALALTVKQRLRGELCIMQNYRIARHTNSGPVRAPVTRALSLAMVWCRPPGDPSQPPTNPTISKPEPALSPEGDNRVFETPRSKPPITNRERSLSNRPLRIIGIAAVTGFAFGRLI